MARVTQKCHQVYNKSNIVGFFLREGSDFPHLGLIRAVSGDSSPLICLFTLVQELT